jgi:hypothetical protein
MKKLLLTAALLGLGISAVQAQAVYLGVGAPGLATIGYSSPISSSFNWRVQASGGLNASLDGVRDGVTATGSLKASNFGAYGDWFPFESSGFRLVGGLSANDIQADLKAAGSGTATIGNKTVSMTGQYYNVNLKFAGTTPYLGIGYGHQSTSKGLGFYADIGVMVGDFTVSSSTSLVTSGLVSQADVNAQNNKMRDGIGSIGFMPSASIGVLYRY